VDGAKDWHFIALVRSGDKWTLHVDDSVFTHQAVELEQEGSALSVGFVSGMFEGSCYSVVNLSDCRVWEAALTATEIAAERASTRPKRQAGLWVEAGTWAGGRGGFRDGDDCDGVPMKPLAPVIPLFQSEQEYDAWRARLSDQDEAKAARVLETLRGIPTKRYQGLEPAPWQGGLIYGPAGVGKTREAIARLLSTPRGVFYSAFEYIEDARAAEIREETEEQELRLREAFRCAHLTLDDLGARRPSEFAVNAVLKLVDRRWSHALETLVTSNMGPREIDSIWGERIASRVSGFGPATLLSGPDMRRG
jgi:hypothetical protein